MRRVIVVMTLRTCAPFPDVRDCSMKVFENHGQGIGQRGKDNASCSCSHSLNDRFELQPGAAWNTSSQTNYDALRVTLISAIGCSA